MGGASVDPEYLPKDVVALDNGIQYTETVQYNGTQSEVIVKQTSSYDFGFLAIFFAAIFLMIGGSIRIDVPETFPEDLRPKGAKIEIPTSRLRMALTRRTKNHYAKTNHTAESDLPSVNTEDLSATDHQD